MDGVCFQGFQGLENQLTALGLPGNRLHQLPVGPISILTGTSLHGLENQLTALGLPGNRLQQLPVGPISILTGTSLHGMMRS
jgi:hypothetical protein